MRSRWFSRFAPLSFCLLPLASIACSSSPDMMARVDAGADVADAASDQGSSADAKPAACAPPADVDHPIEKLSATGCVDPANPTHLAAGVIPYEVNSPLWSDGADKTRGLMLPAGKKIHVKDCASPSAECAQGPADTGKWVLPVGTVLVKSFLFDGKLVETRLFVHSGENTWVGYGYQWDEAQTDATIVPNQRVTISFNTGSRTVDWHFPSRDDCVNCHNQPGGWTIGLETAQMNRVEGDMNQIDRLAAMGAFDAAVPKPYKAALVIPYPGQLGSPPAEATTEQKARSYLHGNCAYCHRPDGSFSNIDLRYEVALKDMNICNTVPAKGDQGVPDSTNLTPGKPDKSIMYLRANATPGNGRMPQIGTYHVDDMGVKVIGDWIRGITSCP